MCDESKNIGAFVHNLSFPKNFTEILSRLADGTGFAIEDIASGGIVDYPVTKWAKPGDIVFYSYAKSSRRQISFGLNFLKHNITVDNSSMLIEVFKEQKQIYKKYGGTIFAIGKVLTPPKISLKAFKYQTMKKLYSNVEILNFLHEPIRVDDIKDFFTLTIHSKNTPIYGEAYEKLKQVIALKNNVSEYFLNSSAVCKEIKKKRTKNYIISETTGLKKYK